jgi:hypothetical protein
MAAKVLTEYATWLLKDEQKHVDVITESYCTHVKFRMKQQ